MKLVLFCSFAFLVHMACAYLPDSPGVRFRLTNGLLNGIWTTVESIVKYHVSKGSSFRGSQLKEFEFGKRDIHFAEPTLLVANFALNKVVVDSKTTLRDEFGKVKLGTMTVTLVNASSSMTLSFNKTESNTLVIKNVLCRINAGTTTVSLEKFEGATEFMKNVTKTAGPLTAAQINGKICPKIVKTLHFVNYIIKQYPTVHRIGGPLMFDLSLIVQPKATSEYLQFDLSGYSYNRRTHEQHVIEFDPHNLIDRVDNKRMIYGFFSDDVINQLMREGQKIEPLVISINQHGSSKSLFESLRSIIESSGREVSQDTRLVKGNSDEEITLSTVEAPRFAFLPNPLKPHHHIRLNMKLDANFKVKRREEQIPYREIIARIDAEAMFNVKVETEEGKRFPRLKVKSHMSNMKVLSVKGASDGVEFSQELLEKISKNLKKTVTREISHKLLQTAISELNSALGRAEEQSDYQQPWINALSIDHAEVTFPRHTMVWAMDWSLDAHALFRPRALEDYEEFVSNEIDSQEERGDENDSFWSTV